MTGNELRAFITKYREALSNLCGADAAYFQGDPNVDAIMELITIAVEQDTTINRQQAELDDLKRDDLPRCKDALRRANEIGMGLEEENKELRAEVEKLQSQLVRLRLRSIPLPMPVSQRLREELTEHVNNRCMEEL